MKKQTTKKQWRVRTQMRAGRDCNNLGGIRKCDCEHEMRNSGRFGPVNILDSHREWQRCKDTV